MTDKTPLLQLIDLATWNLPGYLDEVDYWRRRGCLPEDDLMANHKDAVSALNHIVGLLSDTNAKLAMLCERPDPAPPEPDNPYRPGEVVVMDGDNPVAEGLIADFCSIRTANALRNAGYEKWSDLAGITMDDMAGIKGLGVAGTWEIIVELVSMLNFPPTTGTEL